MAETISMPTIIRATLWSSSLCPMNWGIESYGFRVTILPRCVRPRCKTSDGVKIAIKEIFHYFVLFLNKIV